MTVKKMKKKIQNSLNFVFDEVTMAMGFSQPSMTVPDDTMSLKELLNRQNNGMPLEDVKSPLFYGEDGEGINPATLDIEDKKYYIEKASAELKEIQDKYVKGNVPPPIEVKETEQKLEKEALMSEKEWEAEMDKRQFKIWKDEQRAK